MQMLDDRQLGSSHSISCTTCCTEHYDHPQLASIVFSPRQHLLASWVQVQCMLILRNIAPPGIAQGRIWVDQTHVAQILQSHLVLGLPYPIQIPASSTARLPSTKSGSTWKCSGHMPFEGIHKDMHR